MIKRTVEISRQPFHLSVRLDQLLLQARGQSSSEAATIPCEDIGLVIVDEPGTSWSHAALARLMHHGAAVVVCGPEHLPAGLLIPMSGHSVLLERLQRQVAARRPLKKRLWRQIVMEKIHAQAANLEADSPARRKLTALARKVRSGDPANVEAQAAKVYWEAWLPPPSDPECTRFRRSPDGAPPNNLLNYGYAVYRAAVARAIVSAGLLPALGLHHANRANVFCLADDLVEPLRPLVDARVRTLFLAGGTDLTQPNKARLLDGLAEPVVTAGETGPLMVALHTLVASLVHCYEGEADRLQIPRAP